jgi:predicted DNA binding CopG/RHH family protein
MANMKDRSATSKQQMTPIHSMSEVPQGMTEAQEAEFWSRHYLSDKVAMYPVEKGDPDFPPARVAAASQKISLRVEQDVINRLKAVAVKKRMGYQTLLKEFVIERLYEEEKREGII